MKKSKVQYRIVVVMKEGVDFDTAEDLATIINAHNAVDLALVEPIEESEDDDETP